MAYINENKVLFGVRLKENDAFWDVYQDNGNRRDYRYAFCNEGWNDETFKPKHDIICSGNIYNGRNMFWGSNITEIPVTIDVTGARNFDAGFMNATKLKTIKRLVINEQNFFVNTFDNCSELENITFDGIIGHDINMSQSPKLTHATLTNIINALKDFGAPPVNPWVVENTVIEGYENINHIASNINLDWDTQYEVYYIDNGYGGGTFYTNVTWYQPPGDINNYPSLEISFPHPVGDGSMLYKYIYVDGGELYIRDDEHGDYREISIKKANVITPTIILGATNLAKLTDSEKATANEKGWVLK